MVSSEPMPWVPAEAAREWTAYRSARAVEVNSPLLLPLGDSLIDWLAHLGPAEVPDIVISGSRGHDSRLARFFLGSVSSYLVQQGEASLLVVRPAAQTAAMAEPLRQPPPPQERGNAPRKVAIALDSAADTARAQVRWAIKYALHSNDQVVVLHGPTRSGEMKLKHDSHAYTAAAVVMRGAVDTLIPFVDPKHRPAAVVFSSTEGDDVRDLIVEYVNSNAVDLLIIGRRSIESAPLLCAARARISGSDACANAAKVRKPSTGSVSSYCLHHCNSAVLVVNETTLHADVA